MTARRLAWPLAVGPTGALATVEQDSPADVAQCAALVLATTPGDRLAVPELGMADPTFTGADQADVLAALGRWEPRAAADVTVADVDGAGLVTVTVTLDGRPATATAGGG